MSPKFPAIANLTEYLPKMIISGKISTADNEASAKKKEFWKLFIQNCHEDINVKKYLETLFISSSYIYNKQFVFDEAYQYETYWSFFRPPIFINHIL